MDKTERKFRFTRDALEALPVPVEGRVDYSDTENVGLQLRVSKSGRKMFRVNVYMTERTITNIGPYPELTLTAAKTKHKEIVGDSLGTFVANSKKEARQPTVGEVFQAYRPPSIQSRVAKSRRQESAAPVRPVCV